MVRDVDVVVHGPDVGAERLDLIGKVQEVLIRDDAFEPAEALIEVLQLELHRILVGRRRGAPGRHHHQDRGENSGRAPPRKPRTEPDLHGR